MYQSLGPQKACVESKQRRRRTSVGCQLVGSSNALIPRIAHRSIIAASRVLHGTEPFKQMTLAPIGVPIALGSPIVMKLSIAIEVVSLTVASAGAALAQQPSAIGVPTPTLGATRHGERTAE